MEDTMIDLGVTAEEPSKTEPTNPSPPKGPDFPRICASGKAADKIKEALGGEIVVDEEYDFKGRVKICGFSDSNYGGKSIELKLLKMGQIEEVEGDEEEDTPAEEAPEKGKHPNPAVRKMKAAKVEKY